MQSQRIRAMAAGGGGLNYLLFSLSLSFSLALSPSPPSLLTGDRRRQDANSRQPSLRGIVFRRPRNWRGRLDQRGRCENARRRTGENFQGRQPTHFCYLLLIRYYGDRVDDGGPFSMRE